jgi:hypothetical protein
VISHTRTFGHQEIHVEMADPKCCAMVGGRIDKDVIPAKQSRRYTPCPLATASLRHETRESM